MRGVRGGSLVRRRRRRPLLPGSAGRTRRRNPGLMRTKPGDYWGLVRSGSRSVVQAAESWKEGSWAGYYAGGDDDSPAVSSPCVVWFDDVGLFDGEAWEEGREREKELLGGLLHGWLLRMVGVERREHLYRRLARVGIRSARRQSQ